MKLLLHIVLFLCWHTYAFAQQYYFRGEVQDETGKLLQNVSICQKTTGYIYYTGASGSFGITSRNKNDTLTFSLSGYQTQKIWADAGNYITLTLEKSTILPGANRYRLSSFTKNLLRETQQQWFVGDETYASTIENRFINASAYPTTGVALNVDRASYSNIRRFLNMQSTVPPDAVRIEEMLNYFNFDYKEPAHNKTFELQATLTDCPWNKKNQLLFAKITSKKMDLDTLPPTHLVFLIDVSGSMDMPNRLPILKAGFRSLVNNLRNKDSLSIVVYGGTTGVLMSAVSGAEKDSIFKVIDRLEPGGTTPGESGVKLAYSVAKNHFIKGGNNRVILATDGDFNVGLRTEEDLQQLITKEKESGIYLTCLGVGMGNYKDSKIQTLAQKGNGNFAYIDSYAEAEKVLLQEFTQTLYTVADNAYLNVDFNPALVEEYRVIGFDNKVGAIKDTSAIIEGGEIGPAFSLLVAFEIVPTDNILNAKDNNSWLQPCTFNLQYQATQTKQKYNDLIEPKVKYIPVNRLDKCYQFASAVICFGSVLRHSPFVKEASWKDIQDMATQSAEANNSSQIEFISLVQQARKIYGKRKKGW